MLINLIHGIVSVDGNREDLLEALRGIGDNDCDFNGENGEDYLWEKAKGFESNLEYVIDQVKDIESDEEVIDKFFKLWIAHDSYYGEYSIDYLSSEESITAFSYAIVVED